MEPTGFIGKLECEYVDGVEWLIMAPFTFVSPTTGLRVIIPAGFSTDFASIPRGLWNIIRPTDKCIAYAGVVHDVLYRVTTFPVSRKDADKTLVEGMGLLGASWFKRRAVYSGVRLFGGRSWHPRELASSTAMAK